MGKKPKFTLVQQQAVMEDFNSYMDLPVLWDELSDAINGDGYIPESIYKDLNKAVNDAVNFINRESRTYQELLQEVEKCRHECKNLPPKASRFIARKKLESAEEKLARSFKAIDRALAVYLIIKKMMEIEEDDPEAMMEMLYFNRIKLKRWAGFTKIGDTRAEYMYSAVKDICVKLINTSGKKGVDQNTNLKFQKVNNYKNAMQKAGYSEIDDLVQEVYTRYILKIGMQVGDGSKFRTKTYMKSVIKNIIIDLIFKVGQNDMMRKASGSDVLENIYDDDENS